MYQGNAYPTRRDVLAGGTALAALVAMPLPSARAEDAYQLTALPATARIRPEPAAETAVWAYGGEVPGPVIRAHQGRKLRIRIREQAGRTDHGPLAWIAPPERHGRRAGADPAAGPAR